MFQKGQAGPGRRRGARNRLSHAFLNDLMQEWSEHGAETLRIARVERPIEFVKMVAGLLPREFELEINSTINEISDSDLDRFIDYCRTRIATEGDARLIDGRADAAADREPARLLQGLSETA